MDKRTILITIDLEDWFQVENFKKYIDFSTWDNREWRFENNTIKLLNLFDQYQIKATFFILGWIAERTPNLVTELQARGHEIASHGYNHDLCSSLDENSIYDDIKRSKETLENITGREVIGYRAPSFSISESVIRILKSLGYKYDSSYNSSSLNSRHGKIDLRSHKKHELAYIDKDGFKEIPMCNLNIGNKIFPWSGGGYFRLFPLPLFSAGIKQILRKEGAYVFYAHPWEFDPKQPIVKEASAMNKFRHYLNLNSNFQKLDKFLSTFKYNQFMTCQEYSTYLDTNSL